jgi:hypothetical protein
MPLIAGKDTGKWDPRGRPMTSTRKLTSIVTAAAVALTTFGAVSTTAYAGGYRDGGYGYHDGGRDYRGDRGDYRGGYGYRGGRDRYYAHKKKNNTGKYIAIGAAALMLGIIASEASRR